MKERLNRDSTVPCVKNQLQVKKFWRMSVHEGKIFQCSNCNGEFKSKNNLEVHIAKKHDRKKLRKCAHCGSAFIAMLQKRLF